MSATNPRGCWCVGRSSWRGLSNMKDHAMKSLVHALVHDGVANVMEVIAKHLPRR